MGLDFVALSKLEKVNETNDYDSFIEITKDQYGLIKREPGIYKINGPDLDMRAGSYSSYNIVRNVFSEVIIGEPAESVWQSRDYKNHPIGYLVDFSDCEGIIDDYYCQQIVEELKQYKEPLVVALKTAFKIDDSEYYSQYLDDIIELFSLAADNGCVIFS